MKPAVLFLALLSLGQDAASPLERYRALKFPAKPENFDRGWKNHLLSTFKNKFRSEESIVHATALSDPAGRASAMYGASRKCLRWGAWVENSPCWFVINRAGTITYQSHPSFSTPTSYEGDVDRVIEELKKAAR